MLIFNDNFSTPCMQALIDRFFYHMNTGLATATSESRVSVGPDLATDSTVLKKVNTTYPSTETSYDVNGTHNVFLVSSDFIKALDQFYVKLWNESVSEDSFYIKENIISVFKNFNFTYSTDTFKDLIDRMIDNAFMDESYRLTSEDCIPVTTLVKGNFTRVVDTVNKRIKKEYNITIPMSVGTLNGYVDRTSGSILENKEMYLMFTPFFDNQNTFVPMTQTGKTSFDNQYTLFKSISPNAKIGNSVPFGTHFFYKIASAEEREIYLLEGKTAPDIIYDHTNKISHFDQIRFALSYGGVTVQGA